MIAMKKTTVAILALGASLALAPALYAQDSSPGTAAPKTPGMTDHTGMMGGGMMGGDMASMMKMMENCNRMMQSMNKQSPQDPSTSPNTPPATPGQRG